jgi:hypothetical protein
MCSREDTPKVYAKWERRVIELRTVFPDDVAVTRLGVTGSGVGIIFIRTECDAYTMSLLPICYYKSCFRPVCH